MYRSKGELNNYKRLCDRERPGYRAVTDLGEIFQIFTFNQIFLQFRVFSLSPPHEAKHIFFNCFKATFVLKQGSGRHDK